MSRGALLAVTGKFFDAVKLLTPGIEVFREMGITFLVPTYLSYLATAYMGLGELNDAWRCIQEAMTTIDKTKEAWWEAEVQRVAGEIVLLSPEPDATKANVFRARTFGGASTTSKILGTSPATNMARLWRDQGKVQQALNRWLRCTRVSSGVWHARSERGEGAARRVRVPMSLFSCVQ